ncbi:hypothetical protein S83_033132 [Arachis hypogaea]|nr:Putative ribonuclease H protein [Arachis hypogaea]
MVDEKCSRAIQKKIRIGKKSTRLIGWEVPPQNWTKFNTDGTSRENRGTTSIRGLLRNEVGVWVWEFARKLGMKKAIEIEIYAIKIGLKIAWRKRIKHIIVETDSKGGCEPDQKSFENSSRTD